MCERSSSNGNNVPRVGTFWRVKNYIIKEYTKERNDNIFEHLCSLVYKYYLMIDYSSINDVANVICDLYFKNEKISEKNIREKLENMYL